VNFPTTYVAKSGEQIPVAISGVILYDADGKEGGTIGFAKDLREIIRKDQLAVLGEIAIGLSHEILNPLEVITNQIALLEKFIISSASPEEQVRERLRLDGMRREIHRIEERLTRIKEMAGQEVYESTDYVGDARMIDLSPRPGALGNRHILVVDDDAGVRDTVAEILSAEGCRVDVAENGRKALDYLAGPDPYDLVLSDVVMPEMDGYELYTEVRRRAPNTHVVLMTAFYHDQDHVIKRSRMEGLDGVLFKKPINPERLCSTLSELLQPSST
jgi:CheY-like chemotaxis protein